MFWFWKTSLSDMALEIIVVDIFPVDYLFIISVFLFYEMIGPNRILSLVVCLFNIKQCTPMYHEFVPMGHLLPYILGIYANPFRIDRSQITTKIILA